MKYQTYALSRSSVVHSANFARQFRRRRASAAIRKGCIVKRIWILLATLFFFYKAQFPYASSYQHRIVFYMAIFTRFRIRPLAISVGHIPSPLRSVALLIQVFLCRHCLCIAVFDFRYFSAWKLKWIVTLITDVNYAWCNLRRHVLAQIVEESC